MFASFDPELTAKLIQSAVILTIGLGLFFGLRSQILRFARWAKLPRLALTPVRVAIRYAILVVSILLVLGRWGFQTDGILTVIGTVLGLVAIGFVAMWSVLSNFLCTLVLVILKPFYVGDEIELPTANVKGKVVDLSVVFTTLESKPGETILVPNNMFFQVIFKRRPGVAVTDLEKQLEHHAPPPMAPTAAASPAPAV